MKVLIMNFMLCGLFSLIAILAGCDKQPVATEKALAEKALAEKAPPETLLAKKEFEPYTEKDGYLPPNYRGSNTSDIAKAVHRSFLDILTGRETTETTAEFAKRASLEKFNPELVDLNALYAVLLDNESWWQPNSKPRLIVGYDADKELMHFRVPTENMFNQSICEDLTRQFAFDDSAKAKLKSISSQEHPINCYLADNVTLSISNKNPVFKKNIVRVKDNSHYLDGKYQLDLVDSIKYPLEKARQTNGFNNIGVLFVGKIDKDIKLGDFVWCSGIATRGIPFNLKHIVYFHNQSGEILLKRDY